MIAKVVFNPRFVFTVISGWMLFHTVLFYFGAETLVSEISGLNEKGIISVKSLMEMLGGFSLFVSIVLFSCRDIEISNAKKVLTGAGFGFLCLDALMIQNELSVAVKNPGLGTPLPAIFIWGLLTVWMLYVGLKRDSAE